MTAPTPPPEDLPPSAPVGTTDAARTERWRWWIHLVLIGGYPLLNLPGVLRGNISNRPVLTNTAHGLLVVSAWQLLLFFALFASACFVSRASREQLFLRWRPGWAVVPLGIAYSIAIRIAMGVIVAFSILVLLGARIITPETILSMSTSRMIKVERIVDVSSMRHSATYFWLTVTWVSFVVAALREEMWRVGALAAMRALWPGWFGERNGQFAAVALLAVIFGAGHLRLGVLAAALAGLIGLFLGIIIVLHKSIWPAVIAHGFFDATTFALLPRVVEKLHHLQ